MGDTAKLDLWFFRDLSDDQRLSLFSLFGYPVEEIGPVHGHQRKALRRIIDTLTAAESTVAALRAEVERLTRERDEARKRLNDACRWYWPEEDTSSDTCRDSASEALEEMPYGTIGGYSVGGIVKTRYYGRIPPADDADSDDEFEVDEATREEAEAKIKAEIDRRAARALDRSPSVGSGK